jgi:hypothetical protein
VEVPLADPLDTAGIAEGRRDRVEIDRRTDAALDEESMPAPHPRVDSVRLAPPAREMKVIRARRARGCR